MIESIKKQWFLLGLIAAFIFVVFDNSGNLAKAGLFLKNNNGPALMVFLIFLFSGFIIELDQIIAGIKDVKSTFLALSVILVVSPLIAAGLNFLPLDQGIIIGLFLVAVMPTTLSSGVVMTGKAGGNMAHALFITIISNCIAIISIPYVLSLLIQLQNKDKIFTIDQKAIILKLTFLVLLPLLMGIILKATVLKKMGKQKKLFQVVNQFFIIFIVFMSLSGAKEVLIAKSGSVFIIVPLVVFFHLVLLFFSFFFTFLFKIEKGKKESVIFMGSQKTLPLSVMIQMTCFEEYAIALLVCVLHHITHLMIDGYLCAKLK